MGDDGYNGDHGDEVTVDEAPSLHRKPIVYIVFKMFFYKNNMFVIYSLIGYIAKDLSVDDLSIQLALAFSGDTVIKEEPLDIYPEETPAPTVEQPGEDIGPKGPQPTKTRVLTRRDTLSHTSHMM